MTLSGLRYTGVEGVLYLMPSAVKVTPCVMLRKVDFAIDLEGIAFQQINKYIVIKYW
jgi:hypothetical protein